MAIEHSIANLSSCARQLNAIAKAMAENIDAVNRTMARVAPRRDVQDAVPLTEHAFESEFGREIVLTFLAWQTIEGRRQLGVVRRRVFAKRLHGMTAPQEAETAVPLAKADLTLQGLAVDKLTDFLNRVREDGMQSSNIDEIFDDAPTRITGLD